MDDNRTPGRVTNSTGDIDRNGDVLGEFARIAETIGPLDQRYVERPGLDDRLGVAGADVQGGRRMLGLDRAPALLHQAQLAVSS